MQATTVTLTAAAASPASDGSRRRFVIIPVMKHSSCRCVRDKWLSGLLSRLSRK
jgi:hypothetical protein